jgi:hypothetical protein
MTRRPILTLLLLSLAAAVVATVLALRAPPPSPGEHASRAARPLVMVIEERRMVVPGQGVDAPLIEAVHALAPNESVDWAFELLDADDVAGLARLLRAKPAKVVIFLNENLLGTLGQSKLDASFLVPSELPVEIIDARFGHLRARQSIAFLSWYADDYDKLIDHLDALAGRKVTAVAALYHTSLLASKIDRRFVAAAQRRGVAPTVLPYDDLAGFEHALESARSRADALVVPISEGISNHLPEVARRVADTGLPAAYTRRDQVQAGGLVSVDAPLDEIYDQLGRYTVLILHGADASKLPITQPSRLETTVNLAAAAKIGRTVPFELLVEAHEIVNP